jgi:HprK-related kinase A
MTLSQVPAAQLASRLKTSGLHIRTGPFIVHLQSQLRQILTGVQLLYQDFPLDTDEFADFHIRMEQPRNLHGWYRPQVTCYLNDESLFAPLPIDHAFAMFESCLNWAVFTNIYHYLIIHAAAVERNGYGAILTAPPGAGKSTLCAALVNHGWRLLTDEMTIIAPQAHAILPLARPISLKNQSIEVIQKIAPQAVFGPAIHNTMKGKIAYMRPPRESALRMHERAVPAWLIFPRYEADQPLTVNPLGKAQTFARIPSGLVNYAVLGALGFQLLTGLIDQTDGYAMSYGNLDEAMSWLEQLRPPQIAVELMEANASGT